MSHATTPDGYLIAFPLCCGQPTQLSVFGWRCRQCQRYQPFAYTKKGHSTKWGKHLITKGQGILKTRQCEEEKD